MRKLMCSLGLACLMMTGCGGQGGTSSPSAGESSGGEAAVESSASETQSAEGTEEAAADTADASETTAEETETAAEESSPAPSDSTATEEAAGGEEQPAEAAASTTVEKPVATNNGNTATLKVRFVYGGDPPPREKIDGSKDPFCATHEILSEDLVVGENGGIQNLALYLDERRTDAEIPEEMLKAPPATVELDNKNCVFVPHVFKVRPGQTILVKNSDETGHNANFSFFNNQSVNYLIPAGGSKPLEVNAAEPAPIPVTCNIHPWMKAYVIVTEHPYVGITDENGELEITDLPVGNVTFKIWHESSNGSIEEGTVNGEKQTWRRGRMEIELKPGVNDLGTITLAPEAFK